MVARSKKKADSMSVVTPSLVPDGVFHIYRGVSVIAVVKDGRIVRIRADDSSAQPIWLRTDDPIDLSSDGWQDMAMEVVRKRRETHFR